MWGSQSVYCKATGGCSGHRGGQLAEKFQEVKAWEQVDRVPVCGWYCRTGLNLQGLGEMLALEQGIGGVVPVEQ